MFNKAIILLICVASLAVATDIKTYTFKTVGDLDIKLDVFTPSTSAPATGYPVLFAIHGGAYIEGRKSLGLNVQEQKEALGRGWVIVTIDYRLMPGAVLDDIIEDVQDAYNWVHTELTKITHINLDMITVLGRSAGGGLAVVSAYKLSPRPKVVIGLYSGFTNWTDPLIYNPNTPVDPFLVSAANILSVPVVAEYTRSGSADPKLILAYTAGKAGKVGWLAVTHDPNLPTDQVMAKLRDFSATENVDANFPPTYLAHGTSDKIVPYTQSVQLGNKLKEKNIPYVLDLIPGSGHDFDNNAALWEQHVLPAFDFAAKHMQASSTKGTTKMSFFEKMF
jgi:acetyl esterase/lipase